MPGADRNIAGIVRCGEKPAPCYKALPAAVSREEAQRCEILYLLRGRIPIAFCVEELLDSVLLSAQEAEEQEEKLLEFYHISCEGDHQTWSG